MCVWGLKKLQLGTQAEHEWVQEFFKTFKRAIISQEIWEHHFLFGLEYSSWESKNICIWEGAVIVLALQHLGYTCSKFCCYWPSLQILMHRMYLFFCLSGTMVNKSFPSFFLLLRLLLVYYWILWEGWLRSSHLCLMLLSLNVSSVVINSCLLTISANLFSFWTLHWEITSHPSSCSTGHLRP